MRVQLVALPPTRQRSWARGSFHVGIATMHPVTARCPVLRAPGGILQLQPIRNCRSRTQRKLRRTSSDPARDVPCYNILPIAGLGHGLQRLQPQIWLVLRESHMRYKFHQKKISLSARVPCLA
jgi:hypothetical protein